MKIDVALVLSALLLAVSFADFFTSRERSKRLEDRETIIEEKESRLKRRSKLWADKIKSLKKFRLLTGVEKADRPLTRFREVAVFLYRRSHVRKQQKS